MYMIRASTGKNKPFISLSGTTIEATFPIKFSDVGEAFARRRRDTIISIALRFKFPLFVYLFLNFFLKSFFFLAQLSRTLSNPTDPGSYSTTSDKGERFRSLTRLDLTQIPFAIPSMNPARVMSRQICDAYPQISEQYFIDISSGSQSGVSQDPPTSPLHRISLMARVSLGPSVALLSVGTSTAHDEPQSWQLGLLFASSPTIVSVLQGGGDSDLSLPTSTNLGFCWMGHIPSRGPIAPTWPNYKSCTEAHTSSILKALYNIADPSPLLLKPRSAPLNALFSLVLKICYSIKNGRRRCSISVTKSLDETCYYKSENLMVRVAWLSPDASLILKLMEIEFLSKHRWCDVDHASALSCEYISSLNLSIVTLNHPATILVGDASHYSRTLWMNPPRYDRAICFSSFFKPDDHWFDSNGRRHQSSLILSSALWLCDTLWRFHQTYSFKEIPLLQPYSDIGDQSTPVASSMEHLFKSSYASFARAVFDHKLIGDFLKLASKLELGSLQVSKDLPTFASFLKWCILENSLSLYLYLSCNALISICMNLPLLRI